MIVPESALMPLVMLLIVAARMAARTNPETPYGQLRGDEMWVYLVRVLGKRRGRAESW